MSLENYLLLLRIARLRRGLADFEALRVEVARSFGSEVRLVEKIRRSQADQLKVTPPVFDALLLRFAKDEFALGRTLAEVCADFSGKEQISADLARDLPAVLSDALLRESRDATTLKQVPLDVSRELRGYRRSIWSTLIIACLLIVLLAAGTIYFSRQNPTQFRSSDDSGGSSGGDLGGPDGEFRKDLDDARSGVRSALWLHLLGAGLLVVGLAITLAAKPQSKRKIAGAAVSLLGGLTLFPIKEFQILGKLTDKVAINIVKKDGTNVAAQNVEMQQVCTVATFREAGADIDDPGVQPSLKGCSDAIASRQSQRWSIGFMVLVGHADKRNLRSSERETLGSNEALAFRRALAVKTYFLNKLAPLNPGIEIISMSSGAGNVGRSVTNSDLAKDRSVDVHAYWVRSH